MSISEILIKAIGIILAVVGLAVLLSAVGINLLGVTAPFGLLGSIIVGVILLGAGIYIVRGGNITV